VNLIFLSAVLVLGTTPSPIQNPTQDEARAFQLVAEDQYLTDYLDRWFGNDSANAGDSDLGDRQGPDLRGTLDHGQGSWSGDGDHAGIGHGRDDGESLAGGENSDGGRGNNNGNGNVGNNNGNDNQGSNRGNGNVGSSRGNGSHGSASDGGNGNGNGNGNSGSGNGNGNGNGNSGNGNGNGNGNGP
jgi:hypothetical protein